MLNTKIPPPVVGLCVALVILLINKLFPSLQLDSTFLKIVAVVLVVIGLAIELYSVGLFFKAGTTVNPLKPEKSKVLVVAGLYRFTRNPMYVGMLLLLSALVFWLGNLLAIPALALFVWYITRFQILPEEQALSSQFGEQFDAYKMRVRRWL